MGVFIALFIIISWLSHSAYMLMMLEWTPLSMWMWLHVALQTYLSVGLFITAHDAMHGTVSLNKRINNSLGWIACFLFAGMNYKRLITNHMAHHTFPGTEKDPDYDISQNYVIWFLRFMIRYTTISQLIVMGALLSGYSGLFLLFLALCNYSLLALIFRIALPIRMRWNRIMREHSKRIISMPCSHVISLDIIMSIIHHPAHLGGNSIR